MILNVKVDNLQGIKSEINVSLIASNKIKRNDNELSELDKKNKVLKTLCVIGCNGSGKTSFLRAIMAINSFIVFPFRKSYKENNNFVEQIKKLPDELIKQLLNEFNTLVLPEQNIERLNEKTTIDLEFFIPKRGKNISGIYRYILIYDKNYKKSGVILEKLTYKTMYSSKKENVIFEVANNIESELGTTILYENNMLKNFEGTYKENFEEQLKYYKSFGNEIMNYLNISLGRSEVDIIKCYEDDPVQFLELSRLADNKVINVTLTEEEDKSKRTMKFWIDNKNYLKFEQLSKGTQKILVIGNNILNAIKSNGVLLIDEIEDALHPQLAKFLVMLMNKNNKNNYSQLVFTTHSPLLAFTMEKDQLIYIDNKNNNYEFNSINKAILDGIITKDKNPHKAWLEGLLIRNPSDKEIDSFINQYSNKFNNKK